MKLRVGLKLMMIIRDENKVKYVLLEKARLKRSTKRFDQFNKLAFDFY